MEGVMSIYHDKQRALQDAFDTRRLADIIESNNLHLTFNPLDEAFIAAKDFFFLATADASGKPSCSFKAGPAGFVRVVDERTLAFPCYDGNGMYLSMGNLRVNPAVGLLFIDFERRRRMRLEGVASIDENDPLAASYPEAQFVVRVRATQVYPNCPRYIHQMRLVERSRFVPHAECETPVPAWKRREWSSDVLADGDPAQDPDRETLDA
jgi:predicted pyridoxine 5'-phosphate oxidase superfamily flavin-nucleotide-binding protein